MSDAEELARKERRRQLIERLNEKEKLIGLQSGPRREQMSDEELAAEVEKERTLNAARGSGAAFFYMLDELDLDVPVRLRVDELGQMMARVVQTQTPDSATGQLRLRLRPILGASQPPRVTYGQPLGALNALSPDAIARLEAQRVFSVDDLLRIARNPSGRAALEGLDLETDLEGVLSRADVLTLPMLPGPVTKTLVQIGIEAPTDIVNADAVALAESLTDKLDRLVTVEDVEGWQRAVGEALTLPLPEPHGS